MQERTRAIKWAGIGVLGLAAICWAGPATALDLEASKVRMVERFGLSATDPDVAARIAQANAIQDVTVVEDATGVRIVIEVTGAPEYRGVIFAKRRRYVFDLFNTLNVANGGPWDLGPDSPIRAVRHSQFQVQPDYISRLVCDLAPDVEPIVEEAPGRFTIFVPYGDASGPVLVAHAPDTLIAHDATVADLPAPGPPGPIVLDALEVDDVGVAEPTFATADDAPPAAPASPMGDEAAIAVSPWWMAMDELADEPAPAGDEPAAEEAGSQTSLLETPAAEATGFEGATMAADSAEAGTANADDEAYLMAEVPVTDAPLAAEPVAWPTEPEETPVTEPTDWAAAAPEAEAVVAAPVEEIPAPASEDALRDTADALEEVVEPAPMPEAAPPMEEILAPASEDVLGNTAETLEEIVEPAPEATPPMEEILAPASEDVLGNTAETSADALEEVVEPAPMPEATPAVDLSPAAEAPTPWWVRVEEAAAVESVEWPGEDAEAPVEETVEVAQGDPVDEPFMENLEHEDAATHAEPARTEVVEPVDTPSMPELPEPPPTNITPVLVEEPAPVAQIEPEPLLPEPDLFVPEPLPLEEPAPEMDAGPATADDITTTGLGRTPMEQTVTLTFRDADLNAVLDIIARKGQINVLAGRDVSGTVTVRLMEVPLDVALDAVLNVNGYGYIKTKNIYRIVPLSQIGGDEVETVTETFELSYAVAADVEETLTSFLTRNGSINTDERTNLLIVTDVPQAVARIAELIPQMDRRVQQVMIEVVILDSVLSDQSDLGVQWNLFKANDRTPGAVGPGGFPFVQPGGVLTGAGATSTVANSIQDGLGVVLPSASSGGPGLRLRFGTLIGDFNLSAFIEAQVVNSNARVLANPKLLTLDNSSASIDIVQEIPFQDITQTSSGGQLSNISFKEVGTKLEVTPHVTNDGYVILKLKPEQSSAIAATATGVPIVATRRAETTLLVQDRQTIVLGGLRVNTSNLTRTKIPGLGDIPAIKLLFRSTSSSETDTEILLFLTTHIIESPAVRQHERLVYDELANWPRNPQSQPDLWR